jgi:hypothetical protein
MIVGDVLLTNNCVLGHPLKRRSFLDFQDTFSLDSNPFNSMNFIYSVSNTYFGDFDKLEERVLFLF